MKVVVLGTLTVTCFLAFADAPNGPPRGREVQTLQEEVAGLTKRLDLLAARVEQLEGVVAGLALRQGLLPSNDKQTPVIPEQIERAMFYDLFEQSRRAMFAR